MFSFSSSNAVLSGKTQPSVELMIKMVKDLEDTRDKYHGYSYVRTMRNILVGKEDAAIAQYFKDKDYFGIYKYIELGFVERMMDSIVKSDQLQVIFTDRGKLYCTNEYHDYLCAHS